MIDYKSSATPDDYKCGECGATGCKLWREYSMFKPRLFCGPCAGKNQERDVSTLDKDGKRLAPEYDFMVGQRSDSIGWLVPAVPDEEGLGYWGYTSVPEDGVKWWKGLPTWPVGIHHEPAQTYFDPYR